MFILPRSAATEALYTVDTNIADELEKAKYIVKKLFELRDQRTKEEKVEEHCASFFLFQTSGKLYLDVVTAR